MCWRVQKNKRKLPAYWTNFKRGFVARYCFSAHKKNIFCVWTKPHSTPSKGHITKLFLSNFCYQKQAYCVMLKCAQDVFFVVEWMKKIFMFVILIEMFWLKMDTNCKPNNLWTKQSIGMEYIKIRQLRIALSYA